MLQPAIAMYVFWCRETATPAREGSQGAQKRNQYPSPRMLRQRSRCLFIVFSGCIAAGAVSSGVARGHAVSERRCNAAGEAVVDNGTFKDQLAASDLDQD